MGALINGPINTGDSLLDLLSVNSSFSPSSDFLGSSVDPLLVNPSSVDPSSIDKAYGILLKILIF